MMLAKFGIGPDAVDRNVQVPAAQLVGRAHALKRRVHANFRADRLIDARAHSPRAAHLHVGTEQVSVGRR